MNENDINEIIRNKYREMVNNSFGAMIPVFEGKITWAEFEEQVGILVKEFNRKIKELNEENIKG